MVVIGNQIEAAMFCNVRQIINYVSSSKRESELLSKYSFMSFGYSRATFEYNSPYSIS